MVLLAASLTLWSNQWLCKSLCMSDVGTIGSHLFLCLFPSSSTSSSRNEGAPSHSCHWPGWPHRETEGQWRPPLFPGVWGKSHAHILHWCPPVFQAYKFVSLLCVWDEVLYLCLFDPICMYSNGLLKTSFTDILQTFLQLYYQSHQETTLILNAARCFFTKLAGGVLLKQSVCALMFPRRMLFCRRSLRCNLVRDYLLSVFSFKKREQICI